MGIRTKSYTPFVLRSGLLHSYKRTFVFALLELVVTGVCTLSSGVTVDFFYDPWPYAWLPLWGVVVWLTRRTVDGLDGLFNMFDSNLQGGFRLYAGMQQFFRRRDTRIQSLFTNDADYNDFRVKLKSFSSRRVEIPLAFVLTAVWLIAFVSIWLRGGIYGTFVTPFFQFLVIWNVAFYCLAYLCISSAAWMIVSIMRSIHILDVYGAKLRIRSYIDLLRGFTDDTTDGIDYHAFSVILAPITQLLSTLTLTLVGLIVFLDIYWIAYLNIWKTGMSIGVYSWFLAALGIVIVLYCWPHLEMHRLLRGLKQEALWAAILRRTAISRVLLNTVARSATGVEVGVSVTEIELNKASLESYDLIIRSLEASSTWSFEVSTAVQIMGTLLLPLVVALVNRLLEGVI